MVQVEADLFLAAQVDAGARLRASDGSLVAIATASADLPAGRSMLSFGFSASRIFQHGLPGPYTLGELTLTGTTDTGTAFSLSEDGVVAVTQPYALEDFAPSPSFTVGGTISGLAGFGLVLEIQSGSSVTRCASWPTGPSGSPSRACSAATPTRCGCGPSQSARLRCARC
jgi:hypothetical protein